MAPRAQLRRTLYSREARAVIKAGGGPTLLAAKLGVVPSAITQWKKVPPRHCRRCSEVTGIPLHEIRPDLWDAPKKEPCATCEAAV
jgi:DNA-binding transcriptional regulator YdaS (Cro superfamily)